MPEPTLQEIFGNNATQTATDIIIKKTDLEITATLTNKGETVFAALCKKALGNLTPTAFNGDIDRSISIGQGFDSLIYRTSGSSQLPYYQSQLTINFVKPQALAGITPNDY